MSSSSRIAFLLAATVVVAGVLVGCSRRASDVPVLIPHSAATPDIPMTTSSDGAVAVLESLDPCALLTTQEVNQFGANVGRRRDTSRGRDCEWLVPGGRGVFGITLRNSQGLKDIDVGSGRLSDQRVGHHDGKLLTEFDGLGGCAVIIEISDSSRVDVSSVASNDTQRACHYSSVVAVLIEPRLPRGG